MVFVLLTFEFGSRAGLVVVAPNGGLRTEMYTFFTLQWPSPFHLKTKNVSCRNAVL